MSELTWASAQLRQMAPEGPIKARIRRAADRLKWNYSRARDVWYADPRVALKAHELHQIEAASGLEYGRSELRTNDQLIGQADALLEGVHADFYGPLVAALRAFAGAVDRPRAARDTDDHNDKPQP